MDTSKWALLSEIKDADYQNKAAIIDEHKHVVVEAKKFGGNSDKIMRRIFIALELCAHIDTDQLINYDLVFKNNHGLD
tara:strand:- start:1518 stop:1751 length:234 start_codon:yes stop_codon:yes gene_type:complete